MILYDYNYCLVVCKLAAHDTIVTCHVYHQLPVDVWVVTKLHSNKAIPIPLDTSLLHGIFRIGMDLRIY